MLFVNDNAKLHILQLVCHHPMFDIYKEVNKSY